MLSARRLTVGAGAVLLVSAALLALVSVEASALQTHVFSSSFGSAGTGAGQMALRETGQGHGSEAIAGSEIAIDQSTHDVYVADTGNARVDEFEANGTFIRAWGWGVADGMEKFETCTLICEKGLVGSGAGQFTTPTLIAIDNSGGPSEGDVYVGDTTTNLVSKFSAMGTYLSVNDGSGATTPVAGPFGPLAGIAVDGSGDLWILNTESDLFEFSSTGIFVTDHYEGAPVIAAGIAMNSSNDLYLSSNAQVYETDPNGTYIGAVNPANGDSALTGITVSSSRNIYIDEGAKVIHFTSSCEPSPITATCAVADSFGFGVLSAGSGVGVEGETDNVYVADARQDRIDVFSPTLLPAVVSGEVKNVVNSSATLTGEVEPEGESVTSCKFEYVAADEYETNAVEPYVKGANVPCEPSPTTTAVSVTAQLNKLTPGLVYRYRLVASNKNGENVGETRSFNGGALIESESISNVEPDEATVNGLIDAGAEQASYQIEYGTTASYGSTTPVTGIGSPSSEVAVRLTGLQPGNEYHYRLAVSDAFGRTLYTDRTFTTPTPASSVLPDNRAFELVSTGPANQDMYDPQTGEDTAENYEDVGTSSPSRAAADGDSVTYLGEPPAEGGDGTIGPTLGNQYLATRGATGWTVNDITPAGSNANEYYADFSSDLSIGLFFTEKPIVSASPVGPASCRALYTHTAGDDSYHSLVASFIPSPFKCGEPRAVGISANGSHTLFQTEGALTAGATAGTASESDNIYDSVEGQLFQVNILPDGRAEATPGASVGSLLAAPVRDELEPPDVSNAVSSDGSRVFWSNYQITYPPGQEPVFAAKDLYVRQNDSRPQSPIGPQGECTVSTDACTVQIDAGESQCVREAICSSGGGRFWTASVDGSRVFFTDCVKLTADATANSAGGCQSKTVEYDRSHPTGNDLYEYDVETGGLKDLTVDDKGSDPLGADVQGVIGTSEDGSYVYFVATGSLASGATTGADNLYLLHGGVIQLIGVLSREDNEVRPIFGNTPQRGDWRGALSERTAEVTPDGRDIAFMSVQPLTGYQNGGRREAFIYDAVTGKLSCASCDPTGAAATGNKLLLGNYLPTSVHPGFMDRFMSDDGDRVFFETPEALVPKDTNGLQDVYEWERNGSGSCQAVPPGRLERGCVYILSGGESSDAAFFVDADASGENVFFTSRGKLTPQVQDESVAVYDARVNGGFNIPSLACTGSGCQGVPPAPPIFATPSSVTFNGVGNFPSAVQPIAKSKPKAKAKAVQCKRGSVRKRHKCVRRKPHKKAKRSSTHIEKGRKR